MHKSIEERFPFGFTKGNTMCTQRRQSYSCQIICAKEKKNRKRGCQSRYN